MENKFGRLFYNNNYSNYSNNVINKRLIDYIDYVLRNDVRSISKYLYELKDTYNNINCFMYVLECISNYLVKINNNLFVEYINHDKYATEALRGIKNKYDCIINIYEYYLNKENNDKIINYDFCKKSRLGNKRKIYTNNLKKRVR